MRFAPILAVMLLATGCASQTGSVQLAAGEQNNRCTATIDGRPIVFNTDGRDFSQLRGRAVTIAASADLPNRCVGLLIAALQRAGAGPVTYDSHGQTQQAMAGDEARRPTFHRASDNWSGDRPSYGERARSSEWRGSTMSNFRSAKSDRPKHFTKARSAGR